MDMTLLRRPSAGGATLGELLLDYVHECWTLEDEIRDAGVKVPGKTCIPPGLYRVLVTRSTRFGEDMPLLEDVPGFTGIRMHTGNKAVDTEGCILVGRTLGEAFIGESRLAYAALFPKIKAAAAGEGCWITIVNPGD